MKPTTVTGDHTRYYDQDQYQAGEYRSKYIVQGTKNSLSVTATKNKFFFAGAIG